MPSIGEIDELNIVAFTRFAILGRNAEVSIARDQCRIGLDHAVHKRPGREIEPYRSHVRRLKSKGCHRRLRRKCEHKADPDIFSLDPGDIPWRAAPRRTKIVPAAPPPGEKPLRGIE